MPQSDFSHWHTESTPPPLEKNGVHVWRILLDLVDAPQVEKYLSADERERAARYHFERDRVRFTAGRAVLRILLAPYLKQEPARIVFSFNAQGKPFVNNSVEFNLSHANDLMLLAVTRDMPVGIDVETGRAGLNFMEIAARFFSAQEAQALEKLPQPAQLAVFLDIWTRKEALGKAIGTGIAEKFSAEPVAGQWSVYSLNPAPLYRAALAVRGAGHNIRYLNYSGNHF